MTNFLARAMELPKDVTGKLMFGLEVTIIGILIVFAVLILIMLVIYLFQAIFGIKTDSGRSATPSVAKPSSDHPPVAPAAKAPVPANQEELVAAIAAATAMAQEELIVVLAAAVAAQEGCDPASSRYRIRSFRRIL